MNVEAINEVLSKVSLGDALAVSREDALGNSASSSGPAMIQDTAVAVNLLTGGWDMIRGMEGELYGDITSLAVYRNNQLIAEWNAPLV